MNTLELVLAIVLLVFCLAIILVVLLQEGQQQQVGVVNGAADTFFERNRSRTIDAFLERWTKFISLGFVAVVIALNVVSFLKNK